MSQLKTGLNTASSANRLINVMLIYIEISKETYTKFKSNDPSVASDLYNCLFLPWNIDGNPEVNRKIVAQIEINNKWYGFTSYFRGNFG